MADDVAVMQADYDIAEKANLIWANACGGPDVAAIAAALSRIEHSSVAAAAPEADELVSAIEDAGRGYSIKLVRLVDDVATYELKYRGETTEHESHEDAFEALGELARQEKVAAATAFLARHRANHAQAEPVAPAQDVAALVEALEGLLHAYCSDTGFAAAVRQDTGKAYPWAPGDIAEQRARTALAKFGDKQ